MKPLSSRRGLAFCPGISIIELDLKRTSRVYGEQVEFGPGHCDRQLEREEVAGGLLDLGARKPEEFGAEGRGLGGGQCFDGRQRGDGAGVLPPGQAHGQRGERRLRRC